jgi:hypothetical protein
MEEAKVEKGGGQPKKASRFYRAPIAGATAKAEEGFQGRCDDLKGHIFDCDGRQIDRYTVTMKEMAEHIGSSFMYGADIRWSLEHEQLFVIPKPQKLPDKADAIDKRIWEKEIDEYVKRKGKLEENCRKLFSLVLGQCTDYLKAKLESLASYPSMKENFDVFQLIKSVKGVTFKFEDSKYHLEALHDAKIRFYSLRQDKDMDNAKYLELFQTHVAIVEQFGGDIARDPVIVTRELELKQLVEASASDEQILDAQITGKEKYLAMALIRGADRIRYNKLVDDLVNQFTMGHNNYPVNITAAYNLLINYRITGQSTARIINDSEAVAFATVDKETVVKKDRSHVRCFNCQKKGHFANKCPNLVKEEGATTAGGEEALQQLVLADPPGGDGEGYESYDDFNFHQSNHRHVNPNWILLDTGSTTDIFCNRKLVTDIRRSKGSLKVHCNAGTKIVNYVATLRNYGTVWFNKDGIANILSLSLVRKKFPVKYDSSTGDRFIVSKPEKDIIFAASPSGLYFHDTSDRAVVLVSTVKTNREGFTDREYSQAKAARRALGLVGHPSPKDFKNMVRSNMIRNCTVTATDIDNAYKIFGDDLATLRGKTVRNTQDPVVADYVAIPKEILDLNREVTIAADVLFVNGMPFVTSISRKIKFTTIEYVMSRKEPDLINSLVKVVTLYKARGLNPSTALMDREFECLRNKLLLHGMNLNTTAASEHVPDIERQIRTIKERARALRSTLPFKAIPGRMIIEMMAHVVLWLNAFPPASGVSKTFSPRTIMTGTALDFQKHCQIPFGAYAEVHEDRDKTNTMEERTQPAICLGPTANFQGSYKFLSLRTGKRITRKQFKELPMPDSIITRVEAMAAREKQDKTITFCDRSGVPITDDYDSTSNNDDAAAGVYNGQDGQDGNDEFDPTNEPPGISLESEDTGTHENTGVATDIADGTDTRVAPADTGTTATTGVAPTTDAVMPTGTTGVGPGEITGVTPTVTPTGNTGVHPDGNTGVAPTETTGVHPDGNTGVAPTENTEVETSDTITLATEEPLGSAGDDAGPPPLAARGEESDPDDSDDEDGAEESHNEIPDEEVYHPGRMTPSIQRTHGLRPRKPRSYGHMFAHATVMHHAMTQYSLKKGLRKFQKVGEAAVSKELRQLHMRDTFTPQKVEDLSEIQKRGALESLMFLKEKRDGSIKGRACADGRKQRETATPGDATSPTVSLEAVLITAAIEAHEERDVAIVDVPGAFLSADMDEEVIMTIRGRLAELMVKAAPNIYRKYITLDANNQPILYVKLQKALYGCLRSALLFYEKLVGDLKSQGFEINPYDPCVANKTVAGKQFTLTWHVDDIKMSHKDPKEITKVIEWLKGIYGDSMHVSRGTVHDYLGMTLDYTTKGEVKVTMVDYLKGVLGDFPEAITGTAPTPAAEHLFDVRPDEERKILNEEQARAFHHSVAQLLFASSRARKDIQTAVSFLTTRVREPDEDDWTKLKRLLTYIRATIYMPLILRADSISIIKWWVDASYATHGDCRGHTGATMSLGRGSIIGMSKKQKLNTKSSTECELVGVDDASPQMLWTRYFVEAQGYGVKASILNQDNLSAILLEKNGRASSGKRTKHINVRYFFIKDRIASGEITVQHCPAASMLADHFTKPTQGTMFRTFRAEIQGIPIDMCDADMGWDRPCPKSEQKQDGGCPSPQECVEVPSAVPTRSTKIVGTVGTKDTRGVSKDTLARKPGGQRVATRSRLRSAGRSYSSVLRGG